MSHYSENSATLEATSLLHVLISIADRMVSGTLVFESPKGNGQSGAVVFEQGKPTKACAATPHCRLSDLLVEHGWLDADSAEQTYAMAFAQHERHGQLLLEYRLVDESGLTNLLQYQMLRRLEWLASRPASTVLTLHPNIDLLRDVPPVPASGTALSLVWSLAKAQRVDRQRQRLLTRIGNRALRLSPTSNPDVFGFDRNEKLVVQRLREGPTTLSSLLLNPPVSVATAEALVYVLVLTRHIKLDLGPLGVAAPMSSHLPPSGEYAATRDATTNVSVPIAERAARRALATEALRRAEHWLKRDRLEHAEAEAARAVAFAPTDARCIALFAWVRALKPGSHEELLAILESLTQALDLEPMDVQTRFYRAQILKRLDRLDEAVAEWRLIIEIRPDHIDSLRELRLWEMRQGSARPPKRLQSGTQPQVSLNPPPPGLFGRLFRGKR